MRQGFYLFLVLLITLASCSSYKAEVVDSKKFKKVLEDSDVQLIDVRTPGEFVNGHLPKAKNIDFFNPDFQRLLGELDKSKPVAVYCQVGQRSHRVYELLQELEFKEVYELEGGLAAWHQAGEMLVKR